MKYPTIYYQMKKMIEICEASRKLSKNQDYIDMLICELETACIEIECDSDIDEYSEPEELGSDYEDIKSIFAA